MHGRGETITVVDANSNAVLDTRTITNFTGGVYLYWSVSGHVKINVTWTAGANAVISGVFFGSANSIAPQITSLNSTTLTVGTAGTFNVTATGSPTPTLSESGALPSGVTFNSSTGVLSGTPAAGSNGSYSLSFTASNGVSPSATQSFTLTVTQGLAITSSSSTTFTVGTAGTFNVTATGSPTPTLSESGALPSGVTFNSSTGVLSGTPAAGSSGSYSLSFTASNGVSPSATQSFTLTVTQGLAITSVVEHEHSRALNVRGSFSVTATGSPTPFTLSESGALPSGVTFNCSTGVLSGTPAAGSSGSYSLSFTASNGVTPECDAGFHGAQF